MLHDYAGFIFVGAVIIGYITLTCICIYCLNNEDTNEMTNEITNEITNERLIFNDDMYLLMTENY
jgi:hypothetical protein